MVDQRDRARRVTSADVAAASGVSRATVSYVLNGTPGHRISDRTRDHVLQVARDLGHVPSAAARMLRRGVSDIVLAIVRDFSVGYISDGLLTRLDAALARRGFVLLVHRFDESVRRLDELQGRVDPAIIVTMGGIAESDVPEELGVAPVFRVHGILRHDIPGRMQVEYLHGRGHERIGYASPEHAALERVASERLEGVRSETQRLELPAPCVERVDTLDVATVFSAIDAWLAADVTAVCAHNDEIGLLIVAALAERGTPDALAVMGVDNIPAARVGLTTVEIDLDVWGGAIVDAVVARLDGAPPAEVGGDFLRVIPRASA